MKHLKLGLVQTGDPLKLCTDQYNAFCDAMKDVLGVELIQSEWEINGAEDAERIATAFEARAVDLTVLMCCSLVGDGRVIQPFIRSHQEVVVWCLPEPTREGPLLLNSMTCANLYTSSATQMSRETGGKRAKWIYGLVEDPLMMPRLLSSIRAIRARKSMQGATLVQVGKTAEGFINLGFDAEAIHDKSGVNVVFCSLEEIFRDMNAVSDADATALAGTIACGARCCTGTVRLQAHVDGYGSNGCRSRRHFFLALRHGAPLLRG